jgi:ABC-type sugar transport system ATPase subunit
MNMLRFEHVSKRYPNGTVAVDDLDFEVREGELVTLVGPSGCGKTTTMKLVNRLEEPTAGRILLDGEDVAFRRARERDIAFVFQLFALYPHMTVRQNISFPLAIRHLPSAEIKARVDKVLDLLALHPFADRDVKMLSGGAQQRTSIGRALVRDPQLILFDEPLSHLDGDQKVHLRTEIKRLQKLSAVTSILVTHDQTEATAMSDRIAVMNQGVLQQVATPHDVYERPANMFVANFIGEPPMNLLPLRAGDGRLELADAGWVLPLDERRIRLAQDVRAADGVTAGIRPEHVRLRHDGRGPFRAIVQYCEPRGDTDVVVVAPLEHRATTITAEVPGPAGYRPDVVVGIEFVADRIYLFANADGRNLESSS